MELKIINIEKGQGSKPNEEFVFLKVIENVNLKHFVIGDNSFTPAGDLSNKHAHYYRFPDQAVKKGEFVALFSGTGRNTSFTRTDKAIQHSYYWCLKTCIWNNEGDVGHLLKVTDSREATTK